MDHGNDKLVTIGELARRCGVSVTAIKNWEKEGRIPAGMRLSGGRGDRVWPASVLTSLPGRRAPRKATELSAA